MGQVVTPVFLNKEEVNWARKRLILGDALADIADALGVSTRDLDLCLWRRVIRHGARL